MGVGARARGHVCGSYNIQKTNVLSSVKKVDCKILALYQTDQSHSPPCFEMGVEGTYYQDSNLKNLSLLYVLLCFINAFLKFPIPGKGQEIFLKCF